MLRESYIEYIQESGLCFIQQVRIKEWPKEITSITATPSTCIKISDENIQKSKSGLKKLIFYVIKLQPNSIQLIILEKNWP